MEVLPALSLLPHAVRILPAQATALLDAPPCDAVLVDGRRDLPHVRSLTRLIRQTGIEHPLIVIVTEGGLTALQRDWGIDEFVVDTVDSAGLLGRSKAGKSGCAGERRVAAAVSIVRGRGTGLLGSRDPGTARLVWDPLISASLLRRSSNGAPADVGP